MQRLLQAQREVLVNDSAAFRTVRGFLCTNRFQDRLSGGDLGAASHHQGNELRELRVDVQAQLRDLMLDPFICGDLFLLAGMHRLEVGQDYIGEQSSNGFERIFHEQILIVNLKERLITNSGALVMYGDDWLGREAERAPLGDCNSGVKRERRRVCYGFRMKKMVVLAIAIAVVVAGSERLAAQTVNLPTSKQLIGEIPGHPQRLNSLPMSMAVSPDGRYVVTVNAGYGTYESQYEQSLAVLDTQTGVLEDFPDARTLAQAAKQTLYSGLAFSRRRKPFVREHGLDLRSAGRWQWQDRQCGGGVQLQRRQDRAGAADSLPLQQLAAGQKDDG